MQGVLIVRIDFRDVQGLAKSSKQTMYASELYTDVIVEYQISLVRRII